jgi:hypothetical protein
MIGEPRTPMPEGRTRSPLASGSDKFISPEGGTLGYQIELPAKERFVSLGQVHLGIKDFLLEETPQR